MYGRRRGISHGSGVVLPSGKGKGGGQGYPCGCKFTSHKTAKKHKCPKAKVEHPKQVATGEQAPQATPAAKLES